MSLFIVPMRPGWTTYSGDVIDVSHLSGSTRTEREVLLAAAAEGLLKVEFPHRVIAIEDGKPTYIGAPHNVRKVVTHTWEVDE